MLTKAWLSRGITVLICAVILIAAVGSLTAAAEDDIYLSDLTPVTVAPEIKDPDTGAYVAGYTADSVLNPYNGSGNTLLLNGTKYEKGVGLLPYCDRSTGTDKYYDAEVEFDISEYSQKCNAFTATVGRRDWPEEVGPYTYSMICSVYVDGVLAAQSPSLTFGETHEFCVNIAGASKLKLVTNKGTDTEHYDCSVWANAKLKKDDSLFQIKNIELQNLPVRMRYAVGENLYFEGSRLMVNYTDGTSAEVFITEGMVSGYDPEKRGKQELTIQYLDRQFPWTVYVTDLIYLSDLTPAEVEVLENEVDSLGRDTNSKGQPIMINSRLYKKGIGVHPLENAPARVTYDISEYSGTYNFFYAVVAKDDSAPVEGHYIQCNVYGDDKQIAGSDFLEYGDEYIVAVNIAGVSKLTIEITNGDDGYSWDSTCIADSYIATGNAAETEFVKPAKSEYAYGESFDPAGSVIRTTYDSGFVTEIIPDGTMISGFDSTVPGKQTVTVTYGDNTYTFDVVVAEAAKETPAPATPIPAASTSKPNEHDPERTDEKDKNNIAPYVIIAVAAVVIIASVILILSKKKKK